MSGLEIATVALGAIQSLYLLYESIRGNRTASKYFGERYHGELLPLLEQIQQDAKDGKLKPYSPPVNFAKKAKILLDEIIRYCEKYKRKSPVRVMIDGVSGRSKEKFSIFQRRLDSLIVDYQFATTVEIATRQIEIEAAMRKERSDSMDIRRALTSLESLHDILSAPVTANGRRLSARRSFSAGCSPVNSPGVTPFNSPSGRRSRRASFRRADIDEPLQLEFLLQLVDKEEVESVMRGDEYYEEDDSDIDDNETVVGDMLDNGGRISLTLFPEDEVDSKAERRDAPLPPPQPPPSTVPDSPSRFDESSADADPNANNEEKDQGQRSRLFFWSQSPRDSLPNEKKKTWEFFPNILTPTRKNGSSKSPGTPQQQQSSPSQQQPPPLPQSEPSTPSSQGSGMGEKKKSFSLTPTSASKLTAPDKPARRPKRAKSLNIAELSWNTLLGLLPTPQAVATTDDSSAVTTSTSATASTPKVN